MGSKPGLLESVPLLGPGNERRVTPKDPTVRIHDEDVK